MTETPVAHLRQVLREIIGVALWMYEVVALPAGQRWRDVHAHFVFAYQRRTSAAMAE